MNSLNVKLECKAVNVSSVGYMIQSYRYHKAVVIQTRLTSFDTYNLATSSGDASYKTQPACIAICAIFDGFLHGHVGKGLWRPWSRSLRRQSLWIFRRIGRLLLQRATRPRSRRLHERAFGPGSRRLRSLWRSVWWQRSTRRRRRRRTGEATHAQPTTTARCAESPRTTSARKSRGEGDWRRARAY